MPKASINKNSKMLFYKGDVWLSNDAVNVLSPSPHPHAS